MSTTAPRAAVALVLFGLLGLTGACRLPYTGGAHPVSAAELDTGWQRAKATPIVRQERRADCGLAALAMIGGAWGRQWTVDQLARELPPAKDGIKLGALRDLARRHGLIAYAIRGTQADLARELAHQRPVLLGLVLPFERDKLLNHYEVVIAFDPRDGSVVTVDPATGKHLRRSREVLAAEWKAGGFATLVVVGDSGEHVAASS